MRHALFAIAAFGVGCAALFPDREYAHIGPRELPAPETCRFEDSEHLTTKGKVANRKQVCDLIAVPPDSARDLVQWTAIAGPGDSATVGVRPGKP